MPFSALLIGHDTLTFECARMLTDAGHRIAGIATRHAGLADWAAGRGISVVPAADLPGADWLLSIANLDILPPAVVAKGQRGAVNFHDGPLPEIAGLNAPVWAILSGAARHGITWHLIEGGVDEGRIVAERRFDIAPDDTAVTLNTKCFGAALDSFPAVIAALDAGLPDLRAQTLPHGMRKSRADRPETLGLIDPTGPRDAALRLVRALDHGTYPNPVARAKVALPGGIVIVTGAEPAADTGAPGTVLAVDAGSLTIACADGALRLMGLLAADGGPVDASTLTRPGDALTAPAQDLSAALSPAIKAEPFWRARLVDPQPLRLPPLGGARGAGPLVRDLTPGDLAPVFAALVAAMDGRGAVDIAVARPTDWPGLQATVLPVRITDGALPDLSALPPSPLSDLTARTGRPLPQRPEAGIALAGDALIPGTALTLSLETSRLIGCPDRLSPAAFALIADRLEHALTGATDLPASERARVIHDWNATARAFDDRPVQDLIAAQVARTPAAPAVAFEAVTLTYADLDARANRLAQRLRGMGVTRGSLVGLHLRRSADLVVAALAIWKAGGAYVPLDPAYPADRIALYIEDSAAPVIVTQAALVPGLPPHKAQVLVIDTDAGLGTMPATPPDNGAGPEDLAYLIYTSGSTGRPKGVMVTHRNVANFFAGMDDRIGAEAPGVWLAVTSLSFDISVLELFWTLARGFKVVLSGDDQRALVAGAGTRAGGAMDFSLYYWGNDDGEGRDKYALLLDGARFADDHGFVAVWTPERHFHAFGGPYPNPSVTGAAVAGATRRIGVRAGSCVAPLHHPARIAEEWAVIDNLTNGRAGIAFASGWQPDDFVLRPENAPPGNKAAMLTAIDQVRRLWDGQAVAFPDAKGGTFDVRTQPRPVQKRLPVWVTTAGNPDTWREAGAIGANVLTHLLGQSIAEVEGKIAIYHAALRDAGHDPADFTVTLMLHTFLADTRDEARAIARGPMKDYLRSAAGLIKQYAWAFPAFKKPQGAANPMDIDLRSLTEEELDGILDFAFERYFEDSGLFGTIADAMERVEQLRAIGVTEVACLIDYGIARETVLAGLRPLAQVVAQANAGAEVAADDFSIAAQILRHGVTHLQCTPSMARMLVTNSDSRAALRGVGTLMIGGEALPNALVADLQQATRARILNMYGPTETTIWSTTRRVDSATGAANIGTPIANTQVHVLDDAMQPVPVGAEGELWIGGAGVARGYWQRPDLTADRFRDDPFRPGNRLYRTGDLVRWTVDGTLDFIGRADGQIKLRGHRIELGEIEAAAEALPGVTQAIAMLREDVPGVQQIVLYVTGAGSEPDLRAALARALPPQAVPARVMTLPAFPLTPNRKVDRKALPAPVASEAKAAPVVPRPAAPAGGSADAQAEVAAIWSRVLGVGAIGPRDSFFDLGGHSLLAVQAHRDIRAALAVPALSITDIFRFPTLAGLAGRIEALRGGIAPAPTAQVPPALRPVEPVPGAAAPRPMPEDPRAAARLDAMARRRDMRARRGAG